MKILENCGVELAYAYSAEMSTFIKAMGTNVHRTCARTPIIQVLETAAQYITAPKWKQSKYPSAVDG